jgi:hypothetical protein
MVSNTRPDHGTRAMLTSGPSITFVPFRRCSSPMAAPHCSIRSRDHACDTVSCDGHCVTLINPSATPWRARAYKELSAAHATRLTARWGRVRCAVGTCALRGGDVCVARWGRVRCAVGTCALCVARGGAARSRSCRVVPWPSELSGSFGQLLASCWPAVGQPRGQRGAAFLHKHLQIQRKHTFFGGQAQTKPSGSLRQP